MNKILLTGTLGFIGSNFVRKVVNKYSEYSFVGVDKAMFSYNLLNNVPDSINYKFYLADIADKHVMNRIFEIERPNTVINFAAESHVDNSITNIDPFLHTNIIGTQSVIDCCLRYDVKKLLHISTDEVYGQTFDMKCEGWKERDNLNARNPYSCSKAAAELIVLAAHHTHGLQYNITRSCNVYGPRQKRENLIPHIIYNLQENRAIRIHGNGLNFRQYIYVEDKINAIMSVLQNGKPNEVYNIGDNNLYRNIEMVHYIAKIMKVKENVEYVKDRKAHDYGYRVDTKKLLNIGWIPRVLFEDGIKETVLYYKAEM
jgi:dTDP-glucose 4,6-dehydratase